MAQLGVVHIAAYSPEARGRSERMFGTLQDRLTKELALAGIDDMAAANAWIRVDFLPRHNARFKTKPALPDSAFASVEANRLIEALCLEDERTVGRDNTIASNGMRLQIPESPLRRHYVQARVMVHGYPDGMLAVLHGPKVIGRYTPEGVLLAGPERTIKRVPAATSMAPRSAPSRRGLAAAAPAERAERRPTLTAPPREAKTLPSRKADKCAARAAP